jgi:hypothetical protein
MEAQRLPSSSWLHGADELQEEFRGVSPAAARSSPTCRAATPCG